jgi:hypothetical protein
MMPTPFMLLSRELNMRFIPLLLALCLPFVAHTAVAANVVCPPSIVETPNVSTKEAGWIAVAPTGKRRLRHVGIYFGSISDPGAQVPDSETSNKAKATVTWQLPRDKDENDTNTYWIGCSYLDTSAILFQKVDAAVTKCVATYDFVPGGGSKPQLSGMVCR